ncbi:MAG: putative sulfate exporter family transporter [Candidatus Riflebacteria bacterium]|nr:putative sulfate exporter family transporter [Candidatus Riflebacteria bacterium]
MKNLSKLKITFIFCLLSCTIPGVTPVISLVAGISFGLLLQNPFPGASSLWSKSLLQVAVIALGFGLPLSQVLHQAWEALPLTVTGITMTVVMGYFLGRLFHIESKIAALISFGTAICGGSAIAAMAPAIKAKDEEISISLATVFSLNALALVIFPVIGHRLGMSQESFGIWAGLAIHDTSSVVGAASNYGIVALSVATTVKLARALWITPFVMIGSYFSKSDERSSFPYFILGFLTAAIIRTFFPELNNLWEILAGLGRQILVVTLFLVGAGLSRQVLAKVGFKPLFLGIVLWTIASLFSFIAIQNGWI